MYYIEYRTPGSLTRIEIGSDLETMLKLIAREGCRFHSPKEINYALSWAEVARPSERKFIPCVGGCSCTIRKGEAQMTEYTSF